MEKLKELFELLSLENQKLALLAMGGVKDIEEANQEQALRCLRIMLQEQSNDQIQIRGAL